MIVTVTANPSLDRAVRLDAPLRAGEVQRAGSVREDAGGKGVNVARALRAAGIATIAVVPCAADDPYRLLLDRTGIAVRRVEVLGRVRANLTLTDPAGTTTKINLPGPEMSESECSALIAGVVAACEGAEWVVFAGSLPPGLSDGFYADAIAAVRARWGADAPRVAVDTSGRALERVVADAAPDLIKPNEEELSELAGSTGEADIAASALAQARALVPAKVGAALVTLGARGALLVTADTSLRAHAPRIEVASTVGAGDSSLAGYLIAAVAGAAADLRLRTAVAYGAAAASLPGTQIPTPSEIPPWDLEVTPITH
ncbi:1-phosphofructokinase [Microbacterium sp. Root61]|uniref:1-phosphofructokinase n=1 Tax=Microbacterium sp. Root61 TaxID=1736570 RepID=UPI0006FDC2F9|nr:1-phosphofructokinase [Microbacterium sp. Root61]KRA25881.1 1-phosphofructokinase [Microbacterium sp. Root61]